METRGTRRKRPEDPVIQIFADLHAHSHFSDGGISTEELHIRAGFAGLSAIALTDHDTIDGIAPMIDAAPAGAPEVVPGVELSCTEGETEIHLLGYWIDPEHARLRKELSRIREGRVRRAERIVDRLRDFRIVLDLHEVMALTRNGLVGRPHIAEVMVRGGWVTDTETVYRKYLGDGKPAAVPKKFLSPVEGVRLLRDAGGVVSVAHPGVTRVDSMLPNLAKEGLDGLEVWHPKHSTREIERLLQLTGELGLVPTGGSDYHGTRAGATILGHYGLTRDGFEKLREVHVRR